MPGVWLMLDLLLLSPSWTTGVDEAVALSSALTVSYLAWVEFCFSRNGWYPYPLLINLGLPQKLALAVGSTAFLVGATMALKWAHGLVARVKNPKEGSPDKMK